MISETLNKPPTKELLDRMPTIVLRLFGDFDEDQIQTIPDDYKQKVLILTTSDTPKEKLALIPQEIRCLQSESISSEFAKINPAALLNESIRYARENEIEELFFLSSGLQQDIGNFYGMLEKAKEKDPNCAVYYFMMYPTHKSISYDSHLELQKVLEQDPIEFLQRAFPFETASVLNVSKLPLLDEVITKKGFLGEIKLGSDTIQLGGMELVLSIFEYYSWIKKNIKPEKMRKSIPKMMGISLPMALRTNHEYAFNEFYYPGQAPSPLNVSLEVIPEEHKSAKRQTNFEAAIKYLNLTEYDIRILFSNTSFTGMDGFGRYK